MSRGIEAIRRVGKLKAIVGIVVVLGAVVGGAFAAGVVGMPSVTGVENRFAAVDDETTTIETDVGVRNPNVFAIGLSGVSVNYTAELNDVRLAQGQKEGVNLSTGNATLGFRTAMSNQQIPKWWVAHIRDGESSDLVVNARVRSSTLGRTTTLTPVNREISTDLLSAFDSEETRPIDADQPLISDPVLYVNETSAQWGAVSEEETPIRMDFTLYNPKTTPYTMTAIGYDITMNGVPVGEGELEKGTTIPPKSQRTVEATTAIRNGELDRWWVSHLERNQVTELKIDFYAELDLGGGQTVRVPLNALTYTETMETDIFGTKEEAPTGSGSAGTTADDGGPGGETSTESGERQTTTNGGDSTATTESGETTIVETETSTTEEPTQTTTDDGGLLG